MRAWGILGAAVLLVFATASEAQKPSIRAAYAPAGVAVEPGDPAWRQAPSATLSLMAQAIVPPIGGGSVSSVTVRAMHDGQWVAFRLDWADATPDREVGADTFRDAAAIAFPLAWSDPPPSPFMGDPEHPVTVWQWTADLEANARAQGGFADRYPHTEGVWYFPQDAVVHREVKAWRGTDPVTEFVAKGFGTLQRRPTRNVQAISAYEDGRWKVTVRRRLSTGDPNDGSFRPGELTQIIVAIWNGSAGDVNGRKAVTINWVPLVFQPTVGADAAR
jgi:DMSO reductase family type II enzyme heme b subunit